MKAIHYLNQYFGQIGGEEKAGIKPIFSDKLIGSSLLLNAALGDEIEVTHTIICGDNYINENKDEALAEILAWLEQQEFDVFFAGPAFMAGRYGMACGMICKAVSEKFHVPVITSMNEENPGVELFHRDAYIFRGDRKATSVKQDLEKMAAFAIRLLNNDEMLPAAEEGYFGRGIRHQYFPKDGVMAADRMFDMLMKRLNNEPFETELPIPAPKTVPIAPAVKDLSKAKIAIVGTTGIVPTGNPDHIQTGSATIWGKYDVSRYDTLAPEDFFTTHGGFDSAPGNADPNRLVPLDALRAFEKEGRIGSIERYTYSTVGQGTTMGEGTRMANEIVEDMKKEAVDAVIFVST